MKRTFNTIENAKAAMRMRITRLFAHEGSWRDLPLGHYERSAGEKAIRDEYFACHVAAQKRIERLKRPIRLKYLDMSVQQAANLCYRLTNALGSKSIVMLYARSKDVPRGALACYKNRSIHFSTTRIGLSTLIHEITHHLQCENGSRDGHGDVFIWYQNLLYDALEEVSRTSDE